MDLIDDDYSSASPAQFAFLLSSESSLGISRRFNWLSQYCLLESQKELTILEKRLKSKDHQPPDHQLVGRIRRALLNYSALADCRYRLLKYEDPGSVEYNSILNWVYKKRIGDDHSWIFKEGDLMVLDPKPRPTPFGKLILMILTLIPGCVFRRLHVC